MTEEAGRTQLRHPDPAKAAPRIPQEKYELVRTAILQVVGQSVDGVAFNELADKVVALLPKEARDNLGSVGWYTTAVKLDLEAQGLIARVPGVRPQRLRRVQ